MKTKKIKTRAIKAGLSFAILSFFAPSVMFAENTTYTYTVDTFNELSSAATEYTETSYTTTEITITDDIFVSGVIDNYSRALFVDLARYSNLSLIGGENADSLTGNYSIDGSTDGAGYLCFWGNTSSLITIANLDIKNFDLDADYGAVRINTAPALVTNCNFYDNITTGYGGAIRTTSNDRTTVEYSSFTNNQAEFGGAFYTENTSEINNSTFTDNTATASGGAIYNRGEVTVNSSTFTENTAKWGGAVYIAEYDGYGSGVAIINNSTFTGNIASNNGGAIFSSGDITITDTVFTNNSANYGGAIINYLGLMTINVSEGNNLSYVGNTANYGGFLFIEGNDTTTAYATFNIGTNATLTIGDGTVGEDSIESYSNTSISKTGEGTLTVNSSMQYYTGALNVEAGTMNVNNTLGAYEITIGTDTTSATLALKISGDYTLASTSISSITFNNDDSVLKLIASSTSTTSQEYALSKNDDFSISTNDLSKVITYGGTLSGNTFTTTAATTYTAGMTVSSYDNIVINDSVVMSFSELSSTVTLESATDSSESLSAYLGDSTAVAYTFELADELTSGESVVLSFILADSDYSVSDFTIYYKSDTGDWGEATNVSDITYEDGTLSFIVGSFSSYGYTVVPEPSTYALIFGILSLGFVYYRKRK